MMIGGAASVSGTRHVTKVRMSAATSINIRYSPASRTSACLS